MHFLFAGVLKVFLSSFFLLNPINLFCGITPTTFIATHSEVVPAQNLKSGDSICGFDPEQKTYPIVRIEKIEPMIVDTVFMVSTERGSITVSAHQLFYEVGSEQFICAAQLKAGHLFLTKNLEILMCESVEQINTQSLVLDITLQKPHLFFASEANILMHNAVPVLALGIPVAAATLKVVASAALVSAVVYSSKIAKAVKSFFSFFGRKSKKSDVRLNQQVDLSTKFMNQNEKLPTLLLTEKHQESLPVNSEVDNEQGAEENKERNSGQDDEKRTPEDIISDAEPKEEKRDVKQFEKPGNFDDVLKDFENLHPSDVKTIGPDSRGKIVKVGVLPDGRKIIARSWSTHRDMPTLEIQEKEKQKKDTKIRYNPNL